MAFEQEFNEPVLHFAFDDDVPLMQKRKSIPSPITASENVNECFDCNICLDSAQDPVVTLCGHLYCWPCIYKWLQVQSSSHESDEQPKCPVCKAYISNSTLIPLYGRGKSSSDTKKPQWDLLVPGRPQAVGSNTLPAATSVTPRANRRFPLNHFQLQSDSHHYQQYFSQALGSYASMAQPSIGGSTMTTFYSPMVWMIGEMVFPRLFGNSSNMFAHPNSYPRLGSSSPRMRRREMQMDKFLSRVSIFLFCCIVLCLLLF